MQDTLNSTDLNSRLCRVTKFDIVVNIANQAPAAGQGRVQVEHISPNTIIWRESGHWSKCFNDLEFFNAYRWTRLKNDRLGLEHLRFGDLNPVRLVELEKTGTNGRNSPWLTICPHLCGKDSYTLTLSVNPGALTLVWTIEGPEKEQVSTICYT